MYVCKILMMIAIVMILLFMMVSSSIADAAEIEDEVERLASEVSTLREMLDSEDHPSGKGTSNRARLRLKWAGKVQMLQHSVVSRNSYSQITHIHKSCSRIVCI